MYCCIATLEPKSDDDYHSTSQLAFNLVTRTIEMLISNGRRIMLSNLQNYKCT